MIIVSQSKLLILNFNNLLGLGIKSSTDNKFFEIKAYEYGSKNITGMTIGRYETLERTKEILQEITKEYSKYIEIKGGPAVLGGQMDIQPNIFNIPKVYEMPKE